MTHQPRLIAEEKVTYDADDETKAVYREQLRQKLQDPDFRQIEGFPVGENEDILTLSDPPYYTACPNPFLSEIIAQWQDERATLREELGLLDDSDNNGTYQREPFAADVSEGKSGAIYSAHSYHTKVPHKAIMRYILHYTDPGDIIFDGFCGTGMTGVAAQLCGDRNEVESLGYRIDEVGTIYEGEKPISHLGARKAVLNDLSPAAAFIAYNYNLPTQFTQFEREAKKILREVEQECGWMYETWHPRCDDPQRRKAKINFIVWSDVFACPECGAELILWNVAVEPKTRKVKKSFLCPSCGSDQKKSRLDRVQETVYESMSGDVQQRAKRVPVLINYTIGKKKLEKIPDEADLELLAKIEKQSIAYWFPTERIDQDLDLWYERDYRSLGVFTIDGFYTKRNLYMTAYLWYRIRQVDDSRLRGALLAWAQSVTMGFSILNRYRKDGFSQVNQILSGTLYIGAFIAEISPWYALRGKTRRIGQMSQGTRPQNAIVSTCSTYADVWSAESIDYIFVDPPFGSNIIYSDLSIIWESWLRLFTNTDDEAVVHRRKKKGFKLNNYQEMMVAAFASMYRTLKPGRWITVEFHNTQNAVWNAIQEAILRAGFVVADVSTLDKQVGSFKQVTTTSAVKQDLIISAYKPHTSFEHRFLDKGGTSQGTWDFVRHHLGQLPVVLEKDGVLNVVAERQDYLLYDRMVAFHVQRGIGVPLSAPEFYEGLRQRFPKRNGMFFLPDQVPQYDRASLSAERIAQLSLFVNDEKSAIQWLRQQLDPETDGNPQTYQEIQPQFLRRLHQARHEALPELSELLEQNFLQDETRRWYVPDPNKASDLEKLRQKALLREFGQYAEGRGRLRQFRTEAIRAGFAAAYQERDYETIIQVSDRLPKRVLQEDLNLLMYYDNACLRTE